MKKSDWFRVKKRTLLAIAGTVWIIAGVNVSKMGVSAYRLTGKTTALNLFLSFLVFAAFGAMFYKMSVKHSKRISSYEEAERPFWNFFDAKSYLIMAFMMSGGIWLRSSGLVPAGFIAVFYTGLGLALTSAGLCFWIFYFKYASSNDS